MLDEDRYLELSDVILSFSNILLLLTSEEFVLDFEFVLAPFIALLEQSQLFDQVHM